MIFDFGIDAILLWMKQSISLRSNTFAILHTSNIWPIHTATSFHMTAYTDYLMGMKTLLWHSCVYLNGICSSRREEAFATRIISGPYQKQIKRNYTSVFYLYHWLTRWLHPSYKFKDHCLSLNTYGNEFSNRSLNLLSDGYENSSIIQLRPLERYIFKSAIRSIRNAIH